MHQSVGLTMRKMCGELECPEYHLCEIHDLQCYPCHSYCNQTSHNFDPNRCEQQCQDYIHDFIKHYIKASDIQGLFQEELMTFMMVSTVFVIAIALALLSILAVLIWNRKRLVRKIENEGKNTNLKNKLTVSKTRDNAVSTVSETMDKPAMIMAARTSLTTATSSNKLPCEDVTLETQNLTGYDNLGMWNVSPVFSSKLVPKDLDLSKVWSEELDFILKS
ncbi:PREDICTED: protein grindelwald-like [Diuraphis noxia]|uniref:protein grindelwald-like n=1 Tax=Diuraphis noxia TaxID=143948 RepID=UPI000763877C|nr:PREDICTED: protein grindelwald-like [Diuraphis noxia]